MTTYFEHGGFLIFVIRHHRIKYTYRYIYLCYILYIFFSDAIIIYRWVYFLTATTIVIHRIYLIYHIDNIIT